MLYIAVEYMLMYFDGLHAAFSMPCIQEVMSATVYAMSMHITLTVHTLSAVARYHYSGLLRNVDEVLLQSSITVCLHARIPCLYTLLAIVMSSPPISASNLAKSCQISGCSLKQLKHCVNECLTRSFSPASFTLSGFDISYSVVIVYI
jgi:hypothetical protein